MLAGPRGRAQAGAAVPEPGAQARRVRLHPVGELLDPLGAPEARRGLAGHEPQQPQHPLVAEVLGVGGVRVERGLDVVPVHRRADADAGVEPAAGEHVDGGEVLGQPQRVLPAERDHRGAELDPAGALGGGGEHRDRRGDPVLQVPVADPGAVEAEPLAQLDHPQRGLVAAGRVGLVEQADGEEAELLQRLSRRAASCHRTVTARRTYDRAIVPGFLAAWCPSFCSPLRVRAGAVGADPDEPVRLPVQADVR